MKLRLTYFCLCLLTTCLACKKTTTNRAPEYGNAIFMRLSPANSTTIVVKIYTEEMWLAQDSNGIAIDTDTIAPSQSYISAGLIPGNYIYYIQNHKPEEFQITAGNITNITLRF